MSSDKKELSDKNSIEVSPTDQVDRGYVRLPVNEQQYKDFITSLLGSPQSISRTMIGSFDVDVEVVNHLHSMLMQRITQQNKGFIVRFFAKTVYSDNSSTEVSSIEDFVNYNETRPIVPTELHLTWDFLVQFQDKEIHEKQKISISFITNRGKKNFTELDKSSPASMFLPAIFLEKQAHSFINYRIEHTARTWGADIASILTDNINNLMNQEAKYKGWILAHARDLAFALALIVFFGLVNLRATYISWYEDQRIAAVKEVIKNTHEGIFGIHLKLNYWLLNYYESLKDDTLNSYQFFIIIIIPSAFIFVITTYFMDELSLPSFLIFNKAARKDKEKRLAKLQRSWLACIGTVIGSLALGVISNIIFTYLYP